MDKIIWLRFARILFDDIKLCKATISSSEQQAEIITDYYLIAVITFSSFFYRMTGSFLHRKVEKCNGSDLFSLVC